MTIDVTAATVVLAAATIVLVMVTGYYAWQTRNLVEETRKDRRRQLVENALEKAYSPMIEYFRNAKSDTTRERQVTGSFKFTYDEINGIRKIVERYGHYLDRTLLDKIHVKIIDRTETEWQDAEIGLLPNEIEKKYKELREELQHLTAKQSNS